MQQAKSSIGIDAHRSDQPEQYLLFGLAGQVYGLEILNVKEIIEFGEITEIPMTPDFISGVINLRGSVMPVVDLGQRFSGKSVELTKRTSIIITEVKNDDLRIEFGITVDMVNEVLDIHANDIEPAPSFGNQIQTEFIRAVAKIEGKFFVLLDIENVLSIDELSQVESIQGTE